MQKENTYQYVDASGIIPELKRIRANKRLTLQAIYDLVNPGEVQIVSLSSITRIFEKDSENKKFTDDVIRPVAGVLLGMNDTNDFNPNLARDYFDQRNGLQEAIKIRTEQEKQLLEMMDKQASSHKDDLNSQKANYQSHIEALEHTISILEKNNDFYREIMSSLHDFINKDRESKSRLFDEITRLHNEINQLKSYHKGGNK